MVKAMEAAQAAARKAIESTYRGLCTIVEYQKFTDPENKITGKHEVPVISDQPCKLSFERVTPAVNTETATAISQSTKLFLPPEVPVKPGSKLVITQDGVTTEHSASGIPAIYPTHKEIMLEAFEGWA